MNDLTEMVWQELRGELNDLKKKVQIAQQTERALFSDSIPAYTLASAPLAATGGLGNGSSYISLAWISNGRRPGETAGNGTGVLCFHDPLLDTWIRLDTYTAVTI